MVTYIMVLTSLQTDQPLDVIIIAAMIMMLTIKLLQQYLTNNYEILQTNQPWASATNAWESTPTLGAVAIF